MTRDANKSLKPQPLSLVRYMEQSHVRVFLLYIYIYIYIYIY